MPDEVSSRITEDDRGMAVRRVQEAFVEGHISHNEMDDRLQAVLTAKTQRDLHSAVASLPDPNVGRTTRIEAESGRIRRSGPWRVPRVLRVKSTYGRVDLDLSRAIIESPVVDIELELRFGGAKITVPADAVVDIDDLQTVWKQPVYTIPQRVDPGGPRIRISGTIEFGRLKIRHKRR
jgi:Domain of unknown function (DUF1707)